jgi:hypothetical protein
VETICRSDSAQWACWFLLTLSLDEIANMQYARQAVVIIIAHSELHDHYITLLIERVLIPWATTSSMTVSFAIECGMKFAAYAEFIVPLLTKALPNSIVQEDCLHIMMSQDPDLVFHHFRMHILDQWHNEALEDVSKWRLWISITNDFFHVKGFSPRCVRFCHSIRS